MSFVLPSFDRRFLFRLAVASLCTLTPAAAQFEGIVESKNMTIDETGTPQEFTMTMWIMKDMVKIRAMPAGDQPPTTMIYRNDRRLVWLLDEIDRTYFEIPQADHPEQKVPGSSPGDAPAYKIRRTGKTRTILRYPCEQVFITRADAQTEIWGTKKLGNLFQAISKAIGEEHVETPDDWTNEITRMGLFPLISKTKLEGKVVESQEVTRIQSESLAPELFLVPAGYRKLDVGRMLEDLQKKPGE